MVVIGSAGEHFMVRPVRNVVDPDVEGHAVKPRVAWERLWNEGLRGTYSRFAQISGDAAGQVRAAGRAIRA